MRSLPNLDLSPLRSDKLDILSYWRCGLGSHLCPRYSEASWHTKPPFGDSLRSLARGMLSRKFLSTSACICFTSLFMFFHKAPVTRQEGTLVISRSSLNEISGVHRSRTMCWAFTLKGGGLDAAASAVTYERADLCMAAEGVEPCKDIEHGNSWCRAQAIPELHSMS